MFGWDFEVSDNNSGLPNVQVLPEFKRCIQPGTIQEVQHSPKLPLHGATPHVRERTKVGHLLSKRAIVARKNHARTEEPGEQTSRETEIERPL